MDSDDHYVAVQDVSVKYNLAGAKQLVALEGFDMHVTDGEFCSLLGPSGCGKSTVLRIMAGLQRPSIGEVHVGGTPIVRPTVETGVVFQQHNLLPWRTAAGNVSLALETLRVPRRERTQEIQKWLDVVGLGDVADYYPAQLSGGMNQRLGLARALALKPKLLLMDEPFGALDAQTRLLMQEQLVRIWESHRTTVVFVTHDIEEAVYLSDRILVMRDRPGKVIAELPVQFERPRRPDLRGLPEFAELKSEIWSMLRPRLAENGEAQ